MLWSSFSRISLHHLLIQSLLRLKIKVERFRGEITVFLSLILSGVLTLTLCLSELSRATIIKAQVARDFENALTSCLGEYNRPMLDEFGIFALDGAYGGKSFNSKRMVERMKAYMSGINNNSGLGLNYSASDLEVDNYSFITDNCGEEIFDQAVSIMKKKYGLDLASKALGLENDEKEFEEKKKALESTKKQSLGESKPSGNNMFSAIDSMKDKGVLALIMGIGEGISTQEVTDESLLSIRRKDLFENASMPKKDITSKALFNEYLLKNFNSYVDSPCKTLESKKEKTTSVTGKNDLLYELEYILGGKKDDKSNLAEVAEKLVLYREVLNFAYLQTDTARKTEASVIATTLLAVTANPVLIKIGEELLLAAWAYSESICDVRTLLNGGKVPLIKNSANWHTGIESILAPSTTGTNPSTTGLDYKDYLRVMLFMENDANKTIRTMDLMELKVGNQEYYQDFAMDNCIVGFNLSGSFNIKGMFGGVGKSNFDYGGSIHYEMLESR